MNTLLYTVQLMNTKQKEDTATLEILQTIENQNDVTQRHLADKLDVALGLANSYLKRCVHKGLVKVQQAPANRYLYYLTPKGFAEKSRLTAVYLTSSFDFYRKASDSLIEVFSRCESNRKNNIVLCGISELAEIASIRALEYEVKIIGILQFDIQNKFFKLPVWKKVTDMDDFDICILTSLDNTHRDYDFLIKKLDKEKIMVPSILGINHTNS